MIESIVSVNKRISVAVVAVLIVCGGVSGFGETAFVVGEPADLIIVGGTVYTLVPERPSVEAVAVTGQHIVFLGSREEIYAYRGPKTRVLDVTGCTVLPGLVDAHGHLEGLGRWLRQIDLIGTTSASDVRERVIEYQKKASPGTWVEGRGWDQNDWDVKEFPTWKDLESTESHPVFLRRVDGHAAWLNRRALELCGITRDTVDPQGGRIIRDDDGHPTGVLIDKAKDLVDDFKPEATVEERVERLRVAMKECWRYGLTGVHDAGVGEKTIEAYRILDDRGELAFRAYVMLDSDEREFVEMHMKRGPVIDDDHYLTIRAVKLYADGALGSRGAALLAPYADEAGTTGLLTDTREGLLRWTVLALENGYQVCTHAIGDAANRLVLDVYEEALDAAAIDDPRLRIEHAQALAPADIPRFKQLGIIPSMQPTHATSDMYWAEDRLGPKRTEGAYAWRQLLDTGCAIPCGSDFPVESADPLRGIYAALTRQDDQGWPEGGWYPGECMTIEEAVGGFTRVAAFASFEEHIKGTIEPGKLADFTIIDVDVFAVPSRDVPTARVTHTIVGGAVVYTGVGTVSTTE